MKSILTVLLPVILLIGSAMGVEPDWEANELERKAKLQSLIKRLANKSPGMRQAAYAALRDTHVRKRDLPELYKEVTSNTNPHAKKSLDTRLFSGGEKVAASG